MCRDAYECLGYFYAFLASAKKTASFMERREMCHAFFILSIIFVKKGGLFMARSSRLESGFQDRLIETLKTLFPGCMVFKMDQIQGIPDLLVLYGKKWASLECKRFARAKKQPNQDYYVEKMDEMSFSRFISLCEFLFCISIFRSRWYLFNSFTCLIVFSLTL